MKRVEYQTKNGVGYIELPGDATEAKVTGFTTNEKPIKKKKEEEPQINEEPLIPPLLQDVTPEATTDVTKAKEEDEDKLMPITL